MFTVSKGVLKARMLLEWDHRDPVDRTIVATAKKRRLPIITKDQRIRRFYKRTVW